MLAQVLKKIDANHLIHAEIHAHRQAKPGPVEIIHPVIFMPFSSKVKQ